MIFSKAQPSDRHQIFSLWEKVFGDNESVVSRLLNDFAGWDNIYIAKKDSRVVAQLLAVPCSAGGQRGAYLYALATEPEYRSRGIMERLMEYAKEEVTALGGSFFVLIPASLSLFDYYKAHGFENIYMNHIELSHSDLLKIISHNQQTKHNQKVNYRDGKIPVDQFLNMRKKYLGSHVVTFSKDRTQLELEEQWYYGCKAEYCHNGYIIYLDSDEILFVLEIAAASEMVAAELISNAQKRTDCKTIKITFPMYTQNQDIKYSNSKCQDKKIFGHFTNTLSQTPQAQYRWWGKGNPPFFYLRFALDDLPLRIKSIKADLI